MSYLKYILLFSSQVKVDKEMVRSCISFEKLGIDVDNTPRYTTHPEAKEGI